MTTHEAHPTTDHVTRPGGRQVAFAVRGPGDGPVVLLSSAAPGSRLHDPDPAATEGAGVRLVTLDRPGYGLSDPLPERELPTITSAADDAAAVLDQLGVTDAGVAGWSAGGRVVMALAARRPGLVRAVALIGTPAPDEEVPWVDDEQRGMIAELRQDPASAVTALTGALTPMTAEPGARVGMVSGGDADERLLADDEGLRSDVQVMVDEAFRQGAVGLVTDLASYTVQAWGFDPRAVGAPVRGWYGGSDAVVTPDHGRWWTSQPPVGELVVVPGAGHLVVRPAWRDVLTFVC